VKKSEIATTPERSRLMASVRQSGTSVELAVRRIVERLGVHYQTKMSDLPGSPDLANREHMWAIFVHGCFWHAHRGCSLSQIPRSNRAFWKKKFSDNRRRDKENIRRLKEIGYSVLVVWQCELKNEEKLEKKIYEFLNQSKSRHQNWGEAMDNCRRDRKVEIIVEEYRKV